MAAVSAVAVSAPAFAEGFYIGACVSQAFIDENGSDEDDTSGNIFGGFQFNDYFTIEGSYYDFGDISDVVNNVGIDGVSLASIGSIPPGDSFSSFGKLADTTGTQIPQALSGVS